MQAQQIKTETSCEIISMKFRIKKWPTVQRTILILYRNLSV